MSVLDTLARLASEDPAGLHHLEQQIRIEGADPDRQGWCQREARRRLTDRIDAARAMFGRVG